MVVQRLANELFHIEELHLRVQQGCKLDAAQREKLGAKRYRSGSCGPVPLRITLSAALPAVTGTWYTNSAACAPLTSPSATVTDLDTPSEVAVMVATVKVADGVRKMRPVLDTAATAG